MTALWLGLLLTGEFLLASAATGATPGSIALREGKLSVQLAGVPLWQVLSEVGRLSNTRVVWLHGEGRDQQVSVEFTDLPLAEGLERILQRKNFVLFFAQTPTGAQLMQIWVSADRATVQPQVTQAEAPAPTLPPPQEEEPAAEPDEPAPAPVGDVMQQVTQMATSNPDPSTRANAVMYLEAHAQENPEVRGVLEEIARTDPDALVKTAAAEALQAMDEASQ